MGSWTGRRLTQLASAAALCLALSAAPVFSQTSAQPKDAPRGTSSIPQPSEAITPDNASRVVQLAQIGRGTAEQLAYAPDGKLIAVASSMGIYLYDAQTLNQVRLIETQARVFSVAFSRDSRLVAAGVEGIGIQLRQANDGALVRTISTRSTPVSLVFSSDGQLLVSSSEEDVSVWRVSDGALLRRVGAFGRDSYIRSVAYASGQQLLALATGKAVHLRQVSTGKGLWTKGKETYFSQKHMLAFSPDGEVLVLAGDSPELYRASDGTLLRTFSPGGTRNTILANAFSPDGRILASGTYREVQLWRVSDGTLLRRIEGAGRTRMVAFSPDGRALAVLADSGDISLWKVEDGTLQRKLEEHLAQYPRTATLSRDRGLLAIGSYHDVKLWRVSDGSLLRKIETEAFDVAFSLDGQTLASLSFDGVSLWRTTDGARLRTIEPPVPFESMRYSTNVPSVVFSPDQQIVAFSLGNSNVQLARVSDGSLLPTIQGHEGVVSTVAFSADGKQIASGSRDRTVRLWNASNGRLLRTLSGHTGEVNSVAFSPDSQVVASASDDKTVKLWRVSDGRLLRTLSGHAGVVVCVAFSPDGQIVASASFDDTVRLWRASDGALLQTLRGHRGSVVSVAFSSDGRLLVTGSHDGTARMWGVK
ncbi:MAG: WD40 repeat domain-containing protein [Anaerolineae bacterium]|nr:WD40 repeat domain-containing protein [Anaerolineae bacterium]